MKRTFNILSGGVSPNKLPSNGHGQPSLIWNGGRPSLASSNGTNSTSTNNTPKDIFKEREGGGGMRVGKDFQAKIAPMIPKEEQNPQAEADKALLIWCPPNEDQLSEEKLNMYLEESKKKYNYSGEQALGLLFWHKYDITKATQDLGNFSPHSDEWTFEDKALFEQAFQYFGKNFEKMKAMLPEKSIPSLIRHYYRWKKTKSKTSVMDKLTKKSPEETDESFLPQAAATSHFINSSIVNNFHPRSNFRAHITSDSDDDVTNQSGVSAEKCCGNCGVPCSELHSGDNLCNTCFLYFQKTGEYRPLTGITDKQGLGILRNRRKPPKGMYINHDDLSVLASATPQAENVTLKGLETDVLDMKCRLQVEKQEVEILKRGLDLEGLEKDLPKDPVPPGRINARWTLEEMLLATQGVRRYGKDFSKIIPILGTKTETHLRSFYANYQKRFNLDSLEKEHSLEADEEALNDLNENLTDSAKP